MSWMDHIPEKAAENLLSIIFTAIVAFVAVVLRNARVTAVISARLDGIEAIRAREMEIVQGWMERMEKKQDQLTDHIIEQKDR